MTDNRRTPGVFMSSRWLMLSGPHDTVEETLDSGGHLAKDLRGARRWTLDVHAVVGARHSEFSTTISKKCHEHCETNFGAECLAIAVNFSHCPVRGETLILHQRCGRNAPRPLDLTPDSTRLLHFIRNLDAISRRGYCSFLGGLVLDSGDIGAAPSSKEPLCQGISSTPVTRSPLSALDSAWTWRPLGPRTRRCPIRIASFLDRWSRFRAAPRRRDRATWFRAATRSLLSGPDSAWRWRPSGPRTRRCPIRIASFLDRWSRFRAAPRRRDRTTWFRAATRSLLSRPDSPWTWRPSGPRTRRC